MASILNVPHDIILQILSYIDEEWHRADQIALGAVHRRFTPLTDPIVYRKIRIDIDWSGNCRDLSRSPAFLLFRRTVSERPNLAALVEKLKIRWGKDEFDDEPPESLYEDINSLLVNLPNVWSLNFRYTGVISLISRFNINHLDAHFLSGLRKLKTHADSTTLPTIAKYTQLKHLEYLHLIGSGDDMIDDEIAIARVFSHSSPLKRLYLDEDVFLPYGVLDRILKLIPGLEELACNIPGPKRSDWVADMNRNLLPPPIGNLATILYPVQHNLKALELTQGCMHDWSTPTDDRMDLSSFTALTSLIALAKCFFTEGHSVKPRDGVYRLFPPNLHSLMITFETTYHFLPSSQWAAWRGFNNSNLIDMRGSDDEDAYRPNSAVTHSRQAEWDALLPPMARAEEYDWLVELAEHREHLPYLEFIAVNECVPCLKEAYGGWEQWTQVLWDLPPQLTGTFERAGVGLDGSPSGTGGLSFGPFSPHDGCVGLVEYTWTLNVMRD